LIGGYFTELNGNIRNRLVRLNSDGTEDSDFYNNLGTGFNNSISTITIQLDGKILISGTFKRFNRKNRKSLVRLNSDGTEDSAFYNNLGMSFNGTAYTIAVQLDGKILIGGNFTVFNGNIRKSLVRLNLNGTEDSAFYSNLGIDINYDNISALAVQQNGQILILFGGYFIEFNGNIRNRLVRLNPLFD
jgi:uncharacterized delta-60 repeat protein